MRACITFLFATRLIDKRVEDAVAILQQSLWRVKLGNQALIKHQHPIAVDNSIDSVSCVQKQRKHKAISQTMQ
jgi:hypothetical protein